MKILSSLRIARSVTVPKLDKATKARIENLRGQIETPLKCSNCKVPIHEPLTGRYDTLDEVLCKNCFSEKLGEEIEGHPIRASRVRRETSA